MTQPTPTPPNEQELSGVIHRINRLGAASERMFSRLYKGLGGSGDTVALRDQNRQLQNTLSERNVEIERLNSILASIDEGVIMQDNEGRLVLVNETARTLLGSIKAFWQSELGTLFNEFREVTAVDAELSPLTEPTRVQINNRIIGAQLAAVADEDGNRLGTIIVLRDVTREALSDRLKDHFITAISHELRTPMAVIKGVSEMIIEAQALPSRKLLETLSRNVDILDRMIVELLDISELNSDSFSIRHELINLEELICNVAKGQAPETKRAQLDVSLLIREAAQSGRLRRRSTAALGVRAPAPKRDPLHRRRRSDRDHGVAGRRGKYRRPIRRYRRRHPRARFTPRFRAVLPGRSPQQQRQADRPARLGTGLVHRPARARSARRLRHRQQHARSGQHLHGRAAPRRVISSPVGAQHAAPFSLRLRVIAPLR